MKKFDQFQTLESAQKFLEWIPDNCKNNILQVLQNIWKLQNSDERSRCGVNNDLTESMISIKINDKEDIMEYDEYRNDILKKFVWKQLAKRSAIQSLWLQEKLPSEEFIRSIIASQWWDTQEKKYQNFFEKYIKNNLIWYYSTIYTSMRWVNKYVLIRLNDWRLGCFTKDKFDIDIPSSDTFFGVIFFDNK
jgi:hypothetical protein